MSLHHLSRLLTSISFFALIWWSAAGMLSISGSDCAPEIVMDSEVTQQSKCFSLIGTVLIVS